MHFVSEPQQSRNRSTGAIAPRIALAVACGAAVVAALAFGVFRGSSPEPLVANPPGGVADSRGGPQLNGGLQAHSASSGWIAQGANTDTVHVAGAVAPRVPVASGAAARSGAGEQAAAAAADVGPGQPTGAESAPETVREDGRPLHRAQAVEP